MRNFFALYRLKEFKFSILLLYELFFIFVYPLVQTTFYEWLLHVSTVFILLLIKQFACRKKAFKAINIMLLTFLILVFGLDYALYFTDLPLPVDLVFFGYCYDLFFIIYFFYTTLVLLIDLLTEKEPIHDTLSGAASIFLLLGFSWAYVYMYLSDLVPSSFKLLEEPGTNNFLNFLFYSISRLVSMDVGHQVTPVSTMAMSLSLLQAVMGCLYTAIITGEIVGQHIESKRFGK